MRTASRASLAIAVVIAALIGCGSFDEAANDEGAPIADGGASSEGGGPLVVARRDLTVVAEWPTDGALDPALDGRTDLIRVTLTDANDGGRKTAHEGKRADVGPYAFPQFESTNVVDVVIELVAGDGRLIGYGEARRVDIGASQTITVAVRKRILYAINGDGATVLDVRDVVAIDLAPASSEPSFAMPDASLIQLPRATVLALTPDARQLAIAHASSPTTGGVTVLSTSNHQSEGIADLGFVPTEMVLVADGREVLVMPGEPSETTLLARVDLATRAVRPAKSGFQGGGLFVASALTSFDGKKVFMAANHRMSITARTRPYLVEYDVATNDATTIPVNDLDVVTAVSVKADGSEILVAGWSGTDENQASGKILAFDPSRKVTLRATLPANASRPTTLFTHPDGRRHFVSSADLYGNVDSAGADFYVFDGAWAPLQTFPRVAAVPYQLECAVRLPYAPFRVLAGQSDNGNNENGSIVELPADGTKPISIEPVRDVGGSLVSFATPFGKRL